MRRGPLGLPQTVPLTEATSLRGADGGMLGKEELWRRADEGLVDAADVTAEVAAQVAWMRERGVSPTDADGHQHVNVHPMLRGSIEAALIAAGVRATRVPADAGAAKSAFLDRVRREAGEKGALNSRADAFIGLGLMGRAMSVDSVRKALLQTEGATIELMCHVGEPNPAGHDEFDRSSDRQHELDVLCSAEFSAMLSEIGIERSPFKVAP